MSRSATTTISFILLTCSLFVISLSNSKANDLLCRAPIYDSKNEEVRKRSVWAGFGYLNARAHEIVYGGPGGADGNHLSHLIWDVNNALTFNLGFEGEINNSWSLFADGVVSLAVDDSDMVDYDWLMPTPYWSDRSVHPNTDLNHYVQIDVGVDYKFIETQNLTFLLRTAYRYTDISFDAYGGSYVYSSNPGFRDLTGNFPANALGISYRQKIPGFYFGPRIDWAVTPKLNVKLGALVGITYKMSDRDHHWSRSALFIEDLEATEFYGASAGIDYALNPSTTLYVEGSYDQYKRTEGRTTMHDPTGTYIFGDQSAGAELQTTQIKAGVRIHGWTPTLFKPVCCSPSANESIFKY